MESTLATPRGRALAKKLRSTSDSDSANKEKIEQQIHAEQTHKLQKQAPQKSTEDPQTIVDKQNIHKMFCRLGYTLSEDDLETTLASKKGMALAIKLRSTEF